MTTFNKSMAEYKKQLDKGDIQTAYRGLMKYLSSLKTHLKNQHPEFDVPSNTYFGHMDISFFNFTSTSIKERKLKVAILFIHEACEFQIWLVGGNKTIQAEYWELLKKNKFKKYPLVPSTAGVDPIVEHVLVSNPDFADLPALTGLIEKKAVKFNKDIEQFLSGCK